MPRFDLRIQSQQFYHKMLANQCGIMQWSSFDFACNFEFRLPCGYFHGQGRWIGGLSSSDPPNTIHIHKSIVRASCLCSFIKIEFTKQRAYLDRDNFTRITPYYEPTFYWKWRSPGLGTSSRPQVWLDCGWSNSRKLGTGVAPLFTEHWNLLFLIVDTSCSRWCRITVNSELKINFEQNSHDLCFFFPDDSQRFSFRLRLWKKKKIFGHHLSKKKCSGKSVYVIVVRTRLEPVRELNLKLKCVLTTF